VNVNVNATLDVDHGWNCVAQRSGHEADRMPTPAHAHGNAHVQGGVHVDVHVDVKVNVFQCSAVCTVNR
jgi:hypothetical protein